MSVGWLKRRLAGSRQSEPLPRPEPLSREALKTAMREVKQAMAAARFEEARARLEALSESNPGDPEVLAHLGSCCYLTDDLEHAGGPLYVSIQADPGNALAHKFLAALLAKQHDPSALGCTRKAIRLNPKDVQLLTLGAMLCTEEGQFDEAAQYLNAACETKPDDTQALVQLEALSKQSTWRTALYELRGTIAESRQRVINRLLAAHRKKRLGADDLRTLLCLLEGTPSRFATALKIATDSQGIEDMTPILAEQMASIFWIAGQLEAMLRFRTRSCELEPEAVVYKLALCHAWLMAGTDEWAPAWRGMTQALVKTRSWVHPKGIPLWEGQRLGRKKLLVYQDQGVGDAILAFRLIPLLAARKIRFDLWVVPSLADLAAQVQGYDALVRSAEIPSGEASDDASDYAFATPLFGIIAALGLTHADVATPNVVVLPESFMPAARQRLRALPGLKIGLIYGGNPERRDDWRRSVPARSLERLATLAGISWVNLMFDERADKQTVLDRFQMLDLMPGVSQFCDTAAIVSELDAVIAVDSSVAHVAAMLAKPVWVLVPSSLDWRWQMGSDMRPWWPTSRVIRSEGPGEWDRAIGQVCAELAEFARPTADGQLGPSAGPR